MTVAMRLVVACCLVLALALVSASALSPSPAELSFSMAELASSATDTTMVELNSFTSEPAELNENEMDAASEGLTRDDIFAELAASTESENEAKAQLVAQAHQQAQAQAAAEKPKKKDAKKDAKKKPEVPVNPTVAIVNGKAISKKDFASSNQTVTVPKLLDPQPRGGVRAKGKRTPGFHCEHRTSCDSCLRLASCLWNAKTSKCASLTKVGRLSRREQWEHITTCDPNATPTEKHTDYRSRQGLRVAEVHRPIDNRRTFVPIPASLVEVNTEAEAEVETETEAETEAALDAELEAEADAKAESTALAAAELDSEVDSESETVLEAEAEADADAEIEAETEVEAEVEAEAEVDSETETETDSDSDADSDADADADAETDVDAETDAEADSDSDALATAFLEYSTTMSAAHEVLAGARVLEKLKNRRLGRA